MPNGFWFLPTFPAGAVSNIQVLQNVFHTNVSTNNLVLDGYLKSSNFWKQFISFELCIWRSYQCLAIQGHIQVCHESSSSSSTKFLGLDCIPAFTTKCCLDIPIPVLKSIFNFSLSQHIFPSLWKQAAVVPISKKGKTALINYYRLITIFNTFSKIFEIIIH